MWPALNALHAFENIRWIAEVSKRRGLAFRGRQALCARLVIGREAARFAMQLECETVVTHVMAEAVRTAFEEAEPEIQFFWRPLHKFDQYDNFEQRGDDFIAAAKLIIKVGCDLGFLSTSQRKSAEAGAVWACVGLFSVRVRP